MEDCDGDSDEDEDEDEDEDDGCEDDGDDDDVLVSWLDDLKPARGSIPANSDTDWVMPSELNASGICDVDIVARELSTSALT